MRKTRQSLHSTFKENICQRQSSNRRATSELSRQDVIEKYPDVSPFVILKTDIQRRSLVYTARALATVDPQNTRCAFNHIFGNTVDHGAAAFPVSLLLRDGTSVIAAPDPAATNPYVVDHIRRPNRDC